MIVIEQLLHLPGAYIWLPMLVFFGIVGGFFCLTRTSAVSVKTPAEESLQTVTAVKAPDQRGAFRRHGNPVQVHIAPPDQKQNPEIGSVLDRSGGGMRLALYHEVEVGAIVAIRPVNVAEMVPWIEVEIRSCRQSKEMSEFFEVGCQYVKSPPYSIQLLFG